MGRPEQQTAMLDAALGYAARGWRVFPLRDGGKKPRFDQWQIKATADAGQVRRWWERWPNANMGMPTGPLVAIDLDLTPTEDGRETWEAIKAETGIDDGGAWVNLTPRGGHHLIFESNGPEIRNSTAKLGPGVDVRGAGGYVVLPPSRVNGKGYDWEVSNHPDDGDTVPLPPQLIALLTAAGKAKAAAEPVGAVIPKGTRNDTLTSLAGTMRRRGLGADAIEAALQVENANRCQPPLGEKDVQTIAASIGKKEPGEAAETTERRKRPKTAEYVKVLGNLGYTFRINDCNDTLEVAGKAITDPLRAEIRAKMRDIGYWRVNVMEDAYLATGHGDRYHPIRDYLTGLEYDGGQHIGALTAHFTDRADVFPVWLRRWLIGQVAKVMASEQNAMLVLDGPQNLGKSFFVAWLASPLPGYFIEAPIDPSDKDNYVRLISAWMWEVAELGSTTRRADREALKHFISVRHVTVRKPYGRYDIRKPAMAGLIGTINNELGFLTDPTGSRRFLVATLIAIDWDYAGVIDVNQVWAEAVAEWCAGEPWQLTRAEAKLAAQLNEGYRVEDPIENLLREHFEIDPARSDWWTASADILTTLQDHGLRGGTRANQMGISATMTRLGIQKRKHQDRNGYRGIDPIRNHERGNQ